MLCAPLECPGAAWWGDLPGPDGPLVRNGPCWLHQCCTALPAQWLLFHTFPLFWLHINVALLDFSLLLSWQVIMCQREGKEMILGGSLAQEYVSEGENKFATWCLNFIRVRLLFLAWLVCWSGSAELSLFSEYSSQSVISRLNISSYSFPLQARGQGRGDFTVCFFELLVLLLIQHHFQAAETFYLREEWPSVHYPML